MTMFERHVTDRLAPYLDGALPAAERRAIDEHLAECGECRENLDAVRFAAASMQRLPVVQAPDSVWRGIQRGLDPAPAAVSWWRWAAAAVALAAAAFVALRSPEVEWEVITASGPRAAREGEVIRTPAGSNVRIRVGSIGSVDVAPGTELRIAPSRAGEHRLALAAGQIRASITAPPRLFFVETPAGTAVDLGCEYELRCDRNGDGYLRVTAGWVAYERGGRDSLVPAGAVCYTRRLSGPGTPYFEDAPDILIRALARFDTGETGALPDLVAAARVRDTLTLWHVLSRVEARERELVLARMAELSPLPAGLERAAILRLDRTALQRWRAELAWTW